MRPALGCAALAWAAAAPAADPAPCPARPRPLCRVCDCPPPVPGRVGDAVRYYQQAQADRADLQKRYVQPHEWYLGGTALGPAGQRHAGRLARLLLDGPGQVFVEPVNDAALTENRRLALVAELRRFGVADAEARVGIGYPLGEGLYGDDAAGIAPLLFARGFGAGGLNSGLGGGFAGGSGGGGFGGGGRGGFGGRGF